MASSSSDRGGDGSGTTMTEPAVEGTGLFAGLSMAPSSSPPQKERKVPESSAVEGAGSSEEEQDPTSGGGEEGVPPVDRTQESVGEHVATVPSGGMEKEEKATPEPKKETTAEETAEQKVKAEEKVKAEHEAKAEQEPEKEEMIPEEETTMEKEESSSAVNNEDPVATAPITSSPSPPPPKAAATAITSKSGREQPSRTKTTKSSKPPPPPPSQRTPRSPPQTTKPRPPATGPGTIHPNTPIPNADVSLRHLRKFLTKSGGLLPATAGGTQRSSIFAMLFGNGGAGSTDPCLGAYSRLVDILNEDDGIAEGGGRSSGSGEESDIVVESILGGRGDTMSKSRTAVAAFVHLLSVWSHASSHRSALQDINEIEKNGNPVVTPVLLSMAIDAAQSLVAHGCLDGVLVGIGSGRGEEEVATDSPGREAKVAGGGDREYVPAINLLAESVFVSDLSSEQTELSALKFLLTTGCRMQATAPSPSDPSGEGEAMLRGTHLLQTIRVCYHVYLKTGSEPNKTTARAALQQLVASVFARMERTGVALATAAKAKAAAAAEGEGSEFQTPKKGSFKTTGLDDEEEEKKIEHKVPPHESSRGENDNFPSANHRDAFLVLRSLCKLSMRSMPDSSHHPGGGGPSSHYHGGGAHYQHSNSASMWDGSSGHATSSSGGGAAVVGGGGEGSQGHGGEKEKGEEEKEPADSSESKEQAGDKVKTAASPSDGTEENKTAVAGPTPARASSGASNGHHHHPPVTANPHALGGQNPALESKILALELLLYVLQHTPAAASDNATAASPSHRPFQHSGPQFHYAIRHYLCVSLLKNCTSNDTNIVNLSLRLFVPLIQHFRSQLKTEIEAFVTNVFFVILDSKNSTVEHKSLVVVLFEEICSDPATLAEIFLNYDCDLSAVDLFHRIVNTLSKIAKFNEDDDGGGGGYIVAGAGAARMEKIRHEHRELRLDAMRALRQVLASLHSSIVTPMNGRERGGVGGESLEGGAPSETESPDRVRSPVSDITDVTSPPASEGGKGNSAGGGKQTLVEIYDSKKKRREQESEAALRFNQKPSAGIAYASKCGHVDGSDPGDVARYLLQNKDVLDKTQIGEYLGREADYQDGFCLRVLHSYVDMLDFEGLLFDDAIKYYLSGFRLPGEAQKIDRIMEKFAERYTLQNPSVFPTADVAFILAFSIIMLNTDLHNPAIKEERRMTKDGFIRNNRGICDGQDLPEEILTDIFDRIQNDPISLKEDDEARERAGDAVKGGGGGGKGGTNKPSTMAGVQTALSPAVFFGSHYVELDKARESNFQKERDQIVRNTESVLKRKRRSTAHGSSLAISVSNKDDHHGHHHSGGGHEGGKSPTSKGGGHHHHRSSKSVKFVRTEDTGLRDEYVTPMFEVTWAPTLAVFSTAMESANGTLNTLSSLTTEEEMELAAVNAAESMEVCLTSFRLAICTAGLCGNETARDAFVHALSNFSLLGTGRLMEHRHVRCVQSLLKLGRDDGELLGSSWEHVFKALSEVHRLHQLFQLMARNDRVAAMAAERRRRRLEEREAKREAMRAAEAAGEQYIQDEDGDDDQSSDTTNNSDVSYSTTTSSFYGIDDEDLLEDEMDKRAIDEANARSIYDAVSETLIDAIYHRSSSLSGPSIKDFILQLCRVSRMEISGYGGHVGSRANAIDLTNVHYRQQHTLLSNSGHDGTHNQPNIYSLQKLVEATHYNMDSRPRLIFADIWTTVAAHLTSTALHTNAAVAMYAVDSFRQLSIQFLQRDELGVFEFQRKFLKPFEIVMSRSDHVSTKELLLKSVEQIVLLFGSDPSSSSTSTGTKTSQRHHTKSSVKRNHAELKHLGTLRSGWRPILTVLGLAGHDTEDSIAAMGFNMLTSQLRQCISVEKLSSTTGSQNKLKRSTSDSTNYKSVLLAERFVDLVDALLMFVSGPREDMSSTSIDHLVTLSNFLADDSAPLPLLRKRSGSMHVVVAASVTGGGSVEDAVAGSFANGAAAVSSASMKGTTGSSASAASQELELWWPILLGLSRTVGDAREEVRVKSLVTLLGIVNQHFFPPVDNDDEGKKKASSGAKKGQDEETDDGEEKVNGTESSSSVEGMNNNKPPQHGDLQTLQLIFRGVLTPMLEHAEVDVGGGHGQSSSPPPLPDDFEHFITPAVVPPSPRNSKSGSKRGIPTTPNNTWLDSTFEHLMDGCISICLRSISIYQTDALVEEILAMLNSCLLSDSGALAVKGLRRMHMFITKDLDMKDGDGMTDDTWATVCHMLRRCLLVRGLPPVKSSTGEEDEKSNENEEKQRPNEEEEYTTLLNEFIMEERILADRRYVGSNATMIIGSLLCSKEYSTNIGLRWYLFLANGLGDGIGEWERAASILVGTDSDQGGGNGKPCPPHYLENALYGRKWMNRFLLHLTSRDDVLLSSKSGGGGASSSPQPENGAEATSATTTTTNTTRPSIHKRVASAAQNLIKEQTQSLLTALLEKEAALSTSTSSIPQSARKSEVTHITKLVNDLLAGYDKLNDTQLFQLASWLCPMLSACIQSNNKTVRVAVHNLVQRMFEGPLSDRTVVKGGGSGGGSGKKGGGAAVAKKKQQSGGGGGGANSSSASAAVTT